MKIRNLAPQTIVPVKRDIMTLPACSAGSAAIAPSGYGSLDVDTQWGRGSLVIPFAGNNAC